MKETLLTVALALVAPAPVLLASILWPRSLAASERDALLDDQIERHGWHGWHVARRYRHAAILYRRFVPWRHVAVSVSENGRIAVAGDLSAPPTSPGDWACPCCGYANAYHRDGCVRCGCARLLAE